VIDCGESRFASMAAHGLQSTDGGSADAPAGGALSRDRARSTGRSRRGPGRLSAGDRLRRPHLRASGGASSRDLMTTQTSPVSTGAVSYHAVGNFA
jgi:hypothetical protein